MAAGSHIEFDLAIAGGKGVRIPKVGSAVRGSKTGRPIMVAFDLLGRRTALRILWELRSGSLTFRALQDACETSPGLLNTRLRELRATGLVEHVGDGYCLTEEGRRLRTALQPLIKWALTWGRDPAKRTGK